MPISCVVLSMADSPCVSFGSLPESLYLTDLLLCQCLSASTVTVDMAMAVCSCDGMSSTCCNRSGCGSQRNKRYHW